MPYFSQDQKKAIQPLIKAINKKFGINASLSVRHHSEVLLSIASGEIDFIANANEVIKNDPYAQARGIEADIKDSIQVNQYYIDKNFTDKALEYLQEVYKVMMTGNHDNSDAQVDYFDVGWYVSIHIGKWDKPYLFTPAKGE